MKFTFKRSAVIVAALAVVLVFGGSLVRAQNDAAGNGFRISPVRSEYTIEKGASQTLSITIENPTGGNVTARGVVNNFIASDNESGEPRLILEDNAQQPRNNFKNLVGEIPDIALKPLEKKEIPVNISIPEDASAGGYYGAIRFLPVDTEGDGNVALTASVGTIVLIRVPGDLEERLNLTQLSAAQNGGTKSFFTGGDVSVATRLENVGNIHVQPFGKVHVKDMFGKVIHEFELNSTEPRANILPDSIRRFEDEVNKPDRGWFGRYTITANIGYSQGSGDLISASASFWYLPVWFLIVLAVVIVAIVAGVWWFVSRRDRGRRGPIRRF